jgi:hypothetical protein
MVVEVLSMEATIEVVKIAKGKAITKMDFLMDSLQEATIAVEIKPNYFADYCFLSFDLSAGSAQL